MQTAAFTVFFRWQLRKRRQPEAAQAEAASSEGDSEGTGADDSDYAEDSYTEDSYTDDSSYSESGIARLLLTVHRAALLIHPAPQVQELILVPLP